MFNFKTYKTQYEEASAEVASLKKLNTELTEKVTQLEKVNAELSSKSSEQLISKEDLDKLMKEHADANTLVSTLQTEKAVTNTKIEELTKQIAELTNNQKDVEELAAKQAQAILATVGVEKPFVVSEDVDGNTSVLKFKNGASATFQTFKK